MVQPANNGALRAMQARSIWSLLVLGLAGCAQQPVQQAATQVPDPAPAPTDWATPCSQVGIASWYGGSWRGRASPRDLVAAHRSLPFGTSVQVTDVDTGQSVVVRINDRGPFGRGRIIDLSRDAADQLGIRHEGVAKVKLQTIAWPGDGCPF